MIEVSGLLDQKNIGRGKKKNRGGKPIKQTQCHTNAGKRRNDEVDIHPLFTPRLHPVKEVISKVKLGIDIKRINPRYGTKGAPYHDSPKKQPEEG